MKLNTMVPDDKVQVKVQDGWVTLTGTLDWNYEKAGAERAVRDLKGVRGAVNLIELRQRALPQDVKKHIVSALHRNAALEDEAIHVDVAGDKVTFAGKVRTWTDREIAEQGGTGDLRRHRGGRQS
jgi:osmotically-inducible protein OsmY